MERQPNTQYCLSISYGKDSLACLGAIEELGLPLDRVVHAEIWATDDIPADLPPMIEFKEKVDQIIKERYGIDVEHVCATKKVDDKEVKLTYKDIFYRQYQTGNKIGEIYGFPKHRGSWCNSELKKKAIKTAIKACKIDPNGNKVKIVEYIGIAEDEPERLARLDGINKISPLHLIGWTEEDAMKWCIDNDLRSPLYDMSDRGGCWFCHNQSTDQLRQLRKQYPDLWKILLKWDNDSPSIFCANEHSVHDFDKRFELEDRGLVPLDKKFRWKYIDLCE